MVMTLDIMPGKPFPQATVEATQTWAGLEEQKIMLQALMLDTKDILMGRVNNTGTEEINPSDNECELLNDNECIESTRAGGVSGMMPPPPYAQLSSLFDPLEHYAVSCGNVLSREPSSKGQDVIHQRLRL